MLKLSDNKVKIVVDDTGIGMPEAELENVFESFYQIDSAAQRKSGGSGLGLNVCREIVEHYQGRIWVESVLGEGSQFCIILPIGEVGPVINWEI